MKRLVWIALGLLLVGCAPSASVKYSSENHVTIESYALDVAKARQLADAECARYHRRARLVDKPTMAGNASLEDERDFIFACVD